LIGLRDAQADDVAFVVGLVPRFVENGVAGGHTREEVVAGTSRVLADAIAAPQAGDVFLIAEYETGARAGFVYAVTHRDFFTGEPYAHVSEIAVAGSGAGIGTQLMDAIERWARKHGYGLVTLNVVEGNEPARRFYERLGYTPGHRHYVKRLST
jgi:GNAT superfamily N-acetyltransferase